MNPNEPDASKGKKGPGRPKKDFAAGTPSITSFFKPAPHKPTAPVVQSPPPSSPPLSPLFQGSNTGKHGREEEGQQSNKARRVGSPGLGVDPSSHLPNTTSTDSGSAALGSTPPTRQLSDLAANNDYSGRRSASSPTRTSPGNSPRSVPDTRRPENDDWDRINWDDFVENFDKRSASNGSPTSPGNSPRPGSFPSFSNTSTSFTNTQRYVNNDGNDNGPFSANQGPANVGRGGNPTPGLSPFNDPFSASGSNPDIFLTSATGTPTAAPRQLELSSTPWRRLGGYRGKDAIQKDKAWAEQAAKDWEEKKKSDDPNRNLSPLEGLKKEISGSFEQANGLRTEADEKWKKQKETGRKNESIQEFKFSAGYNNEACAYARLAADNAHNPGLTFDTQVTLETAKGTRRADAIVTYPGPPLRAVVREIKTRSLVTSKDQLMAFMTELPQYAGLEVEMWSHSYDGVRTDAMAVLKDLNDKKPPGKTLKVRSVSMTDFKEFETFEERANLPLKKRTGWPKE